MPGRRVIVNDVKSSFDVIDCGQVRLHVAGGVHDGDRVEDRAAVEEAPLVPAGGRGVEAALLGVDAEGQRAAPLRLGVLMPLRPGPLVVCAPATPSRHDPGRGRSGAQRQPACQERPPIKRLRHRNPPRSRSRSRLRRRGRRASAGYNSVTDSGWRPRPYGNLGPADQSAPSLRRRLHMTIAVGDRIPDVKVFTFGDKGPEATTSADVLGQGKVVLFGVPGAFTPDVLGPPPAGVRAAGRRAAGQGCRQGRVRLGQRPLRDGRLGPGPERRRHRASCWRTATASWPRRWG